jgi:hypothetical protein
VGSITAGGNRPSNRSGRSSFIFVRSRRDDKGTRHLQVSTPDTKIDAWDTLIIAGPKSAADRLETAV